jgi:hypothetical protein
MSTNDELKNETANGTKPVLCVRATNYVEYYEKVEPIKRYSLSELMEMTEMELLKLMPQNQCVDEHSESFGYNVTKYIVSFKMFKVIDGSWNIGFYEGHRDKPLKDQYTLFEITYVKDLKIGLIDLFLMTQNRSIEYFNGVKSGRIKISLGESWENREQLGLPKHDA